MFTIVYRVLKQREWVLETDKDRAELEVAKHENRIEVEKDNADKSSSDIVSDAIREGRDNINGKG